MTVVRLLQRYQCLVTLQCMERTITHSIRCVEIQVTKVGHEIKRYTPQKTNTCSQRNVDINLDENCYVYFNHYQSIHRNKQL